MKGLDEKIFTSINLLLYILSKLGGKADFHKIFKILYFADQKHLSRYGSSISSDQYIAMANGPVPSMAYDIFKSLRGDSLLCKCKSQFSPYFDLEGEYSVRSKANAHMDYIAESERECIDESVKENKNLSFKNLTCKSHDMAWGKADKNGQIDTLKMAMAAGAHRDMLEYVKDHIENQSATFE